MHRIYTETSIWKGNFREFIVTEIGKVVKQVIAGVGKAKESRALELNVEARTFAK